MGLLSNRIDKGSLKPGDHIYSWRTAYVYAHHGIYDGNNMVIHFTTGQGEATVPVTMWDLLLFNFRSSATSATAQQRPCSTCPPLAKRRGVISSCLDCFLAGGDLYRYEYNVDRSLFVLQIRPGTWSLADSEEDNRVLYRARYLRDKGRFGSYDTLKNNCEHFAIYCKTGRLAVDQKRIGQSSQVTSFFGISSSFDADIATRRDVEKVEVEDIDNWFALHG